MSEVKRVPLQTLEFPESLGHAAKKEKKGEKGKQLAPSFRFTLTLPESNEKACPEFNYAQLLKAAEKKRRKEQKRDENAANGLDPFDDDDEDKLRDMARRYEAKYGTTTMGRKRHKYDDYVDLGAGYDENDSFIDNTDAYDELVPEEMTTAHGGFYINCGALEFKAADRHALVHNNNNNNNNNEDDESSESSEEDIEDVDSPRRGEKRHVISSSDDDETEDLTSEQPRKKQKIDEIEDKKLNPENTIKKKKKQQNQQNQDQQQPTSQQQEIEILNRRKEKSGETTDAEGGTASEDQDEKKKSEKTDLQKAKCISEKKFDIKKFEKKPSNSNGFDVRKLDIKKLGGKDSNIDDAIESVVNAARVEDESSRDTTDSGKSRGILGTESECDDVDKEEIRLPESLPEDVKEIVNNIKTHAENNKEAKSKFFNISVNSVLFSLEKKLRILNCPSVRLQTYAHLARFLPCSKLTLLNRAKKLYLQEAEYKVREPMQRLKTIIDNVMPSVLDKYVKECQKVADEKGFEGSPVDADSTDEDDSGCKNAEKSKIPKRRFPWTDESKRLVYEIANARRQYFKILRPRKESMESFVATFMDTKVLPLWPPGCVRLQTLLKYSNAVETVIKKKPKKTKDAVNVNSITSPGNAVCNSSAKSDGLVTNTLSQDNEKTSSNAGRVLNNSEGVINIVTQGNLKATDSTIDRKQHGIKNKEKIKENPNSITLENSLAVNSSSSVGKISVVPTAQLMAQKPPKPHIEKFNLMDLTSSSLSITPVNDYQKTSGKTSETKKDVVSITAYSESSNVLSNPNDVTQSVHFPIHRQDGTFAATQSQQTNYAVSNQTSSHSKPVPLKHRLLQENDVKNDKKLEDKDLEISSKADKKDKRRDRCTENKHKSHDTKKRKKDHKVLEQQIAPINPEIVPMPQQSSLSKEEQEQRQIEETVAATNFLSQIINNDIPGRNVVDKRKDNELTIDESITTSLVQPTEQEKDVQMVIRSLKELQELEEAKYSPIHSPVGGGMQKPSKSNAQYFAYQEDYHRLYVKKDDKLRPKDEPQW